MSSKSNLSKKRKLDIQISSDHDRKKKFRCEICDKSFTHVTLLGKHIIAVHEGKNPLNVTFVTKALPLRPEGAENIPLGFQVSDLCF